VASRLLVSPTTFLDALSEFDQCYERPLMADEENVVQLPLVWVGGDEVPILFANQFLGQYHQDDFLLTVGQLAPPALLGTPEERREEALTMSFVPVKVLARFGMTRSRVEDLIGVLQQTLKNFEEAEGGEEDNGGSTG
jgi:hypothetical protein